MSTEDRVVPEAAIRLTTSTPSITRGAIWTYSYYWTAPRKRQIKWEVWFWRLVGCLYLVDAYLHHLIVFTSQGVWFSGR